MQQALLLDDLDKLPLLILTTNAMSLVSFWEMRELRHREIRYCPRCAGRNCKCWELNPGDLDLNVYPYLLYYNSSKLKVK